jgi:hypothetical protein
MRVMEGVRVDGYSVLRAKSPAIPNVIPALATLAAQRDNGDGPFFLVSAGSHVLVLRASFAVERGTENLERKTVYFAGDRSINSTRIPLGSSTKA